MSVLSEYSNVDQARLRDLAWAFDPLGLANARAEFEGEYDTLLAAIVERVKNGEQGDAINVLVAAWVAEDWLGVAPETVAGVELSPTLIADIDVLQSGIRTVLRSPSSSPA